MLTTLHHPKPHWRMWVVLLSSRWPWSFEGLVGNHNKIIVHLIRAAAHGSQVTWGQFLCNLNRWDHGSWGLPLHTKSQVLSLKSQVWHGCLHDNTFFRGEVWDLCWGFGWAKCYPTLNTSLANSLHIINQGPTSMIINRISTVLWGLVVGTCWNDWALGFGTWESKWTGP
jgi:hypothetical protein